MSTIVAHKIASNIQSKCVKLDKTNIRIYSANCLWTRFFHKFNPFRHDREAKNKYHLLHPDELRLKICLYINYYG